MSSTNSKNASWFVYILRCADRSLYTGITVNVEQRLHEHNCDDTKAARYTRARRPVQLVYQEPVDSRSQACIREAEIKKYSKQQKELLIRTAHVE